MIQELVVGILAMLFMVVVLHHAFIALDKVEAYVRERIARR